MSVLSLSYQESGLSHKMVENSWHRYDMKKLRHRYPMYIARNDNRKRNNKIKKQSKLKLISTETPIQL